MSLTAETRADRAGLGIGLILLAFFFFAAVDTSVKWLALAGLPALQLAFMRYLIAFLLSVGRGLQYGQVFEWQDRRVMALVLLRGALLVLATAFNFIALGYLPLSVTSSILNSAPIILTALAVPLLGEKVGPFRWAAVIVGFIGVLIVIRPFGEAFHWATLLMVVNAVAMAFFAILTRLLSGQVATQTMQIYMGALGTGILLVPALLTWQTPESTGDWLLLFAIGGFAWIGHEIYGRAHAFAEASVLIPFNYSFIVYLTLAGLVVFGDVPDAPVLIGAAIIIGSGLVIWWRETQRKGNPHGGA
ncbi:MAG: DMT family transporter [Paracoccaceae bacterium]